MTFYDAFAFGVAAAVVGMYVNSRNAGATYVKSPVDGRTYLVRRTADAAEAADILARLNRKAELLIAHLSEAFPEDDRVALLRQNYSPESLSEGTHETGYTSYSVNKGQKIVMCLRSRDDGGGGGDLEAENVLLYVLLHELAHLATLEVGHTKAFWDNFRFLVREAVSEGLYVDTDYSRNPVKYCGIDIDSSAVTREG
jgi:hypothetical protein